MKKITKRDVIFFVLGVLAMFIFETVYNWEDSVKSFKEGWNSATSSEVIKN